MITKPTVGEMTQILRHLLARYGAPRCSECTHPWEMHGTEHCDGLPSWRADRECRCPKYMPVAEEWFVTRARQIIGKELPPEMLPAAQEERDKQQIADSLAGLEVVGSQRDHCPLCGGKTPNGVVHSMCANREAAAANIDGS